jgi:MATE family multidrug resistance protein
MIVSRAGLAAMGIADGIMVSRYQSHEFAWLSLAEGTLGRLLDVFIAFLIGGLSLAPRHFGRGDAVGARALWLRTLPISVGLGVAGLLVSLAGTPLLRLLGQPVNLAAGAGPVMLILGTGYPAALLAISAAVYLEGGKRPHLVAVSVVAANGLNILLNWVLIGGHLGFPPMGARGSALSTTLVRGGLCLALVSLAWRLRGSEGGVVEAHSAERAASRRAQWRLGLGAASTVAAMVLLTSSLVIFAGWLGVLPLAIFSAAWSLAAPAGLVSLGLADAAGILVASDPERAGTVGWACLRMTLLPMAALAAGLALWPHALAGIYTKEAGLRHGMAVVIPIVALILMADAAGFVMAASLRALREVAWPASIEIGSMLMLVPLALGLAFGRGFGIRGLFMAMLLAGLVRSGMLLWRFGWKTQRKPDLEFECQAI